jgi:hypothetical protein
VTGLWETVGMAKKYTPKEGDQVFWNGHNFVRYLVVSVNEAQQTARVKNAIGSPIALSSDIPWPQLMPLDESQIALRVVRKATEES